MYQIDNPSAATTQPASTAGGTAGYFTGGKEVSDAATGTANRGKHANSVTKTFRTLLAACSLLPAIALAQTYPSPTFNSLTLQTPLTTTNGGTGVTSSTGSGSVVLATSPTLVTPALGTPSSLTLTNASGLPLSGLLGFGTGVAASLANTPTGSGPLVLATLPSLSSPAISGGTINNAVIGSTTSAPGSFTTLAASGNITQPTTGEFFSQKNALIDRMGDRIFLGGFTASDGAYPPVTNDWFSTYENTLGYTNSTPSGNLDVSPANTAHGGTVAATFAAQSLNAAAAGTSTIPVESFAINNNTTLATSAWAFYGEAHLASSAGSSVYGMELDTHSLFPTTSPTPYGQGNVIGLQLAAGAGIQGAECTGSISGTVLTMSGCTNIVNYNIQVGSFIYGVGVTANTKVSSLGTGTGGNGTYNINNSQTVSSEAMVATPQYPGSAAIQIESNPVPFNTGIVFGSNSLAGDDGINGQATAIALGTGHNINWYAPDGSRGASIVSTVSNASNGTGIDFTDNGLQIFSHGTTSPPIAYFTPVSTSVNYLDFKPAVTGGAPVIQAQGSDTNVELYLEGQGAGQVTTGTSPFTAPGNDALFYQNTSAQSIASGSATTVTGWTQVADRLNQDFNASTGFFTAPETGYYQVSAGLMYAPSVSSIGTPYQIVIESHSTNLCSNADYAQTTSSVTHAVSVSCVIQMSAGQTAVVLAIQQSGSAVALSNTSSQNFLSISRIP